MDYIGILTALISDLYKLKTVIFYPFEFFEDDPFMIASFQFSN